MPLTTRSLRAGMSRLWLWLGLAGAAGAGLAAAWRAVILVVAVSLGG